MRKPVAVYAGPVQLHAAELEQFIALVREAQATTEPGAPLPNPDALLSAAAYVAEALARDLDID